MIDVTKTHHKCTTCGTSVFAKRPRCSRCINGTMGWAYQAFFDCEPDAPVSTMKFAVAPSRLTTAKPVTQTTNPIYDEQALCKCGKKATVMRSGKGAGKSGRAAFCEQCHWARQQYREG